MLVSAETTNRELKHERATLHRSHSREFGEWAAGYGVIRHNETTQNRIHALAELLAERNGIAAATTMTLLKAADRLTSAAMWMVVHMTYAQRVRLDGAPLHAAEMKEHPEGHTGGALN